MANLTKAVLSFDDGSTQEFDVAPVPAVDPIVEVDTKTATGVVDSFTAEASVTPPTV
jgi:hypothetical protein